MTLNVMVLENEPGAAAEAEMELRQAGHAVLTCHDAGTAPFPCRGVVQPSACPLHSHGVDVALVVRVGTRAQPTLGEDGARCAVMHQVPLVVAGTPLFDPFDEYAALTVERTDDLVGACEQVAGAPIEMLGQKASAVLEEIAGRRDDHVLPRAVVTRRAGQLKVRVEHGETMTKEMQARAAVRIAMALREIDPYANGIDISIATDGAALSSQAVET
jgi:hypothetical protein